MWQISSAYSLHRPYVEILHCDHQTLSIIYYLSNQLFIIFTIVKKMSFRKYIFRINKLETQKENNIRSSRITFKFSIEHGKNFSIHHWQKQIFSSLGVLIIGELSPFIWNRLFKAHHLEGLIRNGKWSRRIVKCSPLGNNLSLIE